MTKMLIPYLMHYFGMPMKFFVLRAFFVQIFYCSLVTPKILFTFYILFIYRYLHAFSKPSNCLINLEIGLNLRAWEGWILNFWKVEKIIFKKNTTLGGGGLALMQLSLVEKPVCATESCATDQISSRKHGLRDPKQQTSRKHTLRNESLRDEGTNMSRKVSLRYVGLRRAKVLAPNEDYFTAFSKLCATNAYATPPSSRKVNNFFSAPLNQIGRCKLSCSSYLHLPSLFKTFSNPWSQASWGPSRSRRLHKSLGYQSESNFTLFLI